jgi:hypothetical protein
MPGPRADLERGAPAPRAEAYAAYYNRARTHLALDKDAPVSRAVEGTGRIVSRPVLGGLHHRYG